MTVPLPSRAPVPHPTRRLLGRVVLRNCLVVAAALVLLVVLVAGCGQTPLPAAAPSTIAPTTPAPPSPPAAPPTSGITATPDAGGGGGGGGGGDTTSERRTGAPGPQGAAPRPGGAARAGAPIWPAADTASARRLQQSVDGGAQPWLLDPSEVATSYAGAVLGYGNPAVTPRGGGTVDVRDGRSPSSATITLAQTVRPGAGGIWLVTGVARR